MRRFAMMQVAADRFGKPLSQLDQRHRAEAERIARRKLALEKQIVASEEARHVVITSQRVEETLREAIARYPDRDAFEAELEAIGFNVSSFSEAIGRELRVEAVMDLVASRVPAISETDARLFYYFNRERFHRPETRLARHLLVTVNPEFPENTEEQALQRISMIAKRLQKKPGRFAEQAQKHSECPTAMDGGFLGRIKRDMLFPEVEKALFALPVGGVSKVVTSPLGFHLVMCEEVVSAGYAPIEEVLPTLIEKLTARKQKSLQQEWLRGLMRSSLDQGQIEEDGVPNIKEAD